MSIGRAGLMWLVVAATACGHPEEEWQALVAEADDLRVKLGQREWEVGAAEERLRELEEENARLSQQLAELTARYEADTARQQASIQSLQRILARAREQAAQQAAYPAALLETPLLPEFDEPREVNPAPIQLRDVGLVWHWRSSRGGDATVSFGAEVRRDLSEYCTLCTIHVRASCSDDAVTLTDVRAIAEAENVMDMGPGDSAQMSSTIFRYAPLDVQPYRCDMVLSLGETSSSGGGVLLGRYCWIDQRVRSGRCPER